jgi:uncharacterized membrane protein
MNLAPMINAQPVIQFHVILALLAMILTATIFSLPKGSPLHRRLGWAWVVVMALIALSSFRIHTLRWIGPFSPIHLLSLLVLCSLYVAVRAARTQDIRTHQRIMKSLVLYGLLITGAITFMPGRLMHQIISGG